MGLRFRKSFKLCPGVRTTLSLSGVSVSAGVPGARVTASKRGLMSTLGIPGTGIYYQQNLSSGGKQSQAAVAAEARKQQRAEQRRVAAEQRQMQAEQRRLQAEQRRWEAEQRRIELEQRTQQSMALIQQYESQQKGLVDCWRAQVDSIPPSAYADAAALRPFVPQEKPPAPLNLAREKNRLAGEVRKEYLARQPVPKLFLVCVGAGALLPALAALLLFSGFLGAICAVFAYGVSGALAWSGVVWWWSQEFEGKVQAEATERWPDREESVQRKHQEVIAAYQERLQESQQQWQRLELDRTEWARQLVDGNVEALNEAVSSSLSDLDFPFETSCRTCVPEKTAVLIDVDLPELEDVIFTKSMRVKKDGSISERNRKQSTRNEEYAQLVAGLVVLLGTTALSSAPTANRVVVAGYTQRLKRGTMADDYVVVVSLPRSSIADANTLRGGDPIGLLKELGAALEQTQTGKLKSVQVPDWAAFA